MSIIIYDGYYKGKHSMVVYDMLYIILYLKMILYILIHFFQYLKNETFLNSRNPYNMTQIINSEKMQNRAIKLISSKSSACQRRPKYIIGTIYHVIHFFLEIFAIHKFILVNLWRMKISNCLK